MTRDGITIGLPEQARKAARSVAAAAVSAPIIGPMALRLTARRNRGIALLWHRVGPKRSSREVLPSMPVRQFADQLTAFCKVADVVSLDELERGTGSTRPRIALTFDDDDDGHATHALPVLQALGVTATFFLSGRWIHGLGRYWWQVLEDEVGRDGLPVVSARYGRPGQSLRHVAAALEGTEVARRLAEHGHGPPPMSHTHAAALVAAGMEIGFHTVHHPVLPVLEDAELARALTHGAAQLAEDLATPVRRIAYPHGRADRRVAAATAAAGWRSGWSVNKRSTGPSDDPHRRGRWEPGIREEGEALLRLIRVMRQAPGSQ